MPGPKASRVRVASKTQGRTLLAPRASAEGLIAGVENLWKGKTLKSPPIGHSSEFSRRATIINFQTHRFEEEVRDVEGVIDLVGGETQQRSFQVVRRGGKLIRRCLVLIRASHNATASTRHFSWST